ncbi:MAG: ParB/RepB/Spo0J family partition protein [Candidatus Saccharimonadales bacterium]
MERTSKRGLGRGFEALLPSDFDKSILLSADDRIQKIPIDQLRANPHQPRQHFDKTALDELASSIKQYGVIQPLVVSPVKDGKYTLIAGERRWRASIIAKIKNVPAIIRSSEELEQLEVALVENVQRVDLSPLDQAISIEKLHQQFSMSYADIAKRLGKAVTTVINIARLLQLPENARLALTERKITEGHARSILALKGDLDKQTYLLNTIIKQGWSVRQAEQFVVSVKAGVHEVKKAHARTELENPTTKTLSKKYKTPVYIRRTARGGKLEITFKSDAELDRIVGLLG